MLRPASRKLIATLPHAASRARRCGGVLGLSARPPGGLCGGLGLILVLRFALRVCAVAAAVVLILLVFDPLVTAAALEESTGPLPDTGPSTATQQPPPPPPLPVPWSSPIPPGGTTQGWYNETGVRNVTERLPVDFVNSSAVLSYGTSYGTFAVKKTSPLFVSVTHAGSEEAFSAFSVEHNGTLLLPGPATIVSASAEFLSIQYGAYSGVVLMGRVNVTYSFSSMGNKVAVTFDPEAGVSGTACRIVWVGFTVFPVVDTDDPADHQDYFSDLAPLTDIGFTGYTVTVRKSLYSPTRILFDFTDAQEGWTKTLAGRFSFGGVTGNAFIAKFALGVLAIDPTVVADTSNPAATDFPIQRKVFHDGSLYWAFWYGTSIKYGSSADGSAWVVSDLPGNTQNLQRSFTVAVYGGTVAVLWVNKLDTESYPRVRLLTGRIKGDWIRWDSEQSPFVLTGGVAAPVAATFTPSGELAFTFVDGTILRLKKYICTALGTDSPCSSGTFQDTWSATLAPVTTPRAFPVSFYDEEESLAVVYADEGNPVNVHVVNGLPGGCDHTLDILASMTSGEDPAYGLAGVPSGANVSVFQKVSTGAIHHYIVDRGCSVTRDDDVWAGSSSLYVAAGAEWDGATIDVFFTAGASSKFLYYSRVVPTVGTTPAESAGFVSDYPNLNRLTVAASSNRLAPLLFMSGTVTGRVHFLTWPLPSDNAASPQNPWSQVLGAPLFAEVGGDLNPATGLLRSGYPFVSLPAKPELSLSLIYAQAGLYYGSGETAYRFYSAPSQYGRIFGPTVHLDLPWVDTGGNQILHMAGGQVFFIRWDAPGPVRWFNNTKGVRFSLQYNGTAPYRYTLRTASGAALNFDSRGLIAKVFPGHVAADWVSYVYTGVPPGDLLTSIEDSLGRKIALAYDYLRIDRVTYGGNRVVDFDYLGVPSVPSTCGGTSSDSETVRITDVLGRRLVYYVCKQKLVQVDLPTGGKVVYTYARWGYGTQIWQGTDTYSLPVLGIDVYHEAAVSTQARAARFFYHAQNGEIAYVEARLYDGNGILQGVKQQRYRSILGASITRVATFTGTLGHYLDGPGAVATWATGGSCSANWMCVAGASSDGDASYVESNYVGNTDMYSVSNASFAGSRVASVGIHVEARLWYTGPCTYCYAVIRFGMYTHDQYYFDPNEVRVDAPSYQGFERWYATNPITNNPWTADELNALQIGYNLTDRQGAAYARVSWTYADVRVQGDQMSATENWFSVNDQPHLTYAYTGNETEPSVVSQDFVDDWGNSIYGQDPYGNETFRSFANTDRQYAFYAPGTLKQYTKGKLYETGFDNYEMDWSTSGSGSWWLTDGAFRRYVPSLQMSGEPTGIFAQRTFPPSSTSTNLVELNVRPGTIGSGQSVEVAFNSSLGTRAAIRFADTMKIQYRSGTNWVNCSFTYRASTWYRVTVVLGESADTEYSVHVDGIDVCTGNPMSGSGVLNRITLKVYGTTAWFDDITVAQDSEITMIGLKERQSAALVAANGTVIDFQQALPGSGGVVRLNLDPPSPYVFQESGLSVVRVYAVDSTLEYESPHKRFYGGDAFTYIAPRAILDRTVQTRSGHGSWYRIDGDDSTPGTPFGNWVWTERPAVSGQKVHATPLAFGTREHGYTTASPLYTPLAGDYHVQYVYIPRGQRPSEIVVKYANVSGGSTQWRAAYWGLPYDVCATCVSVKNMGPIPEVRDGWVQLLVSASGLGTASRGIVGQSYEVVNEGTVYWDASSVANATGGRIEFDGLSKLGGGAVYVYWANNDTLIGSGSSGPGGDFAYVNLYPKVNATPILGKIKVFDPNGYLKHVTNPRYIWGGDRLTYFGDTGFYDPSYSSGFPTGTPNPPSDIHSFTLGSRTYAGNCWDAVACYDMEDYFDRPLRLADLTPLRNHGTVVGNASLKYIAPRQDGAASGTGTIFSSGSLAPQENVVDSGVSLATRGTLSLWASPYHDQSAQWWRVAAGVNSTSASRYLTLNTLPASQGGGYPRWRVFGTTTGAAPYLQLVSATVPSASRVDHLAVTWDDAADAFQLYVNGRLEASQMVPQNLAALTGVHWFIGASKRWTDPWNGMIDQVILYNRVLSANEVAGLYQSRMPAVRSTFFSANTNGVVTEAKIPDEGSALMTAYEYDGSGNLIRSWSTGRGSVGWNTTEYFRSSFYSGAYVTRVVRPDLREQLYSYDADLGTRLGTLTPDCRRQRTDYDIAGRPLTASLYERSPDIVLHLDMETPDGANNLKDVSCTVSSGLVTGAAESNGAEGKARLFQGVLGSPQYVRVFDAPALRPPRVSVSAWVYPTSLADASIVDRSYPGQAGSGYALWTLADGAVGFSIYDGDATPAVAQSPPGVLLLNAWQLVTGTYDGTSVRVYVDATERGSTPFSRAVAYLAAQDLIVGANNVATGKFFQGRIDEVRVAGRAFSGDEIRQILNQEFGLVGRTHGTFDDGVLTPAFPGYGFHAVTTYDEVSVPRRLLLDMETTKPFGYLEDLSGNGNHAEGVGAMPQMGGKVGNYLSFDGNDFVRIASDPSDLDLTDSFTIAGWFKLTDTGNRWGVSKWISGTCPGSSYALVPANGGSGGRPAVLVCGRGAYDELPAPFSLATGSWRFLAATFDRGDLKLYVDTGSSLATYSKSSSVRRIDPTALPVFVGADSTGLSGGMNGGIDEVHILDRALAGTEIDALYRMTEPSHMTRRYFDGLGRGNRAVVLNVSGGKLESDVVLGWDDQVRISYLPSGQYYTYARDFLGRVISAVTPGDATVSGATTWTFLDANRRAESTDPVGRKGYERTDLLGQVVERGTWNPFNGTFNLTRISYNAWGDPVSSDVVHPSGSKAVPTTTAYYDLLDQRKLVVYPNGRNATYTYDNDLRRQTRTDEMGRVATFVYDSLGRLNRTIMRDSGPSPPSTTMWYGYDPAGNLATIDNGTARIYRKFDAARRMTEEWFSLRGPPPANNSMLYTYDAAGKVLSVTYPSYPGFPVTKVRANYTYDSFARVREVSLSEAKYAEVAYDPFGRTSAIWYHDGSTNLSLVKSFVYDARDRITKVTVARGDATYLDLGYTYDKASGVTRLLDDAGTGAGAKVHTYSYDGQGRLRQAVGPYDPSSEHNVVNLAYDYDILGNIRSKMEGSTTTTYTYLAGGRNQVNRTSSPSQTVYYEYNEAGSVTKKTILGGAVTPYVYDLAQRLVAVGGQAPSALEYDGLGRRVRATEGPSTTEFLYAGDRLLFTRNLTAGQTTDTAYVYLGNVILLRRTQTNPASSGVAFYFEDLSLNVRLVLTMAVAVEVRYRYKPFGEAITLASGLGPDSRFKFAGQELDAGSGLYHMGARYYDAALGRFLASDPLGGGDYSYAANNPISFYDPSGLFPVYPHTYYAGYGYVDAPVGALGRTIHEKWESLPWWLQDIILVGVSILLILVFVPVGWVAAGMILSGLAVGAMYAGFEYYRGQRDSEALGDQFVWGFDVGTIISGFVAIPLARFVSTRGIALVGEELATEELTAVGRSTSSGTADDVFRVADDLQGIVDDVAAEARAGRLVIDGSQPGRTGMGNTIHREVWRRAQANPFLRSRLMYSGEGPDFRYLPNSHVWFEVTTPGEVGSHLRRFADQRLYDDVFFFLLY